MHRHGNAMLYKEFMKMFLRIRGFKLGFALITQESLYEYFPHLAFIFTFTDCIGYEGTVKLEY